MIVLGLILDYTLTIRGRRSDTVLLPKQTVWHPFPKTPPVYPGSRRKYYDGTTANPLLLRTDYGHPRCYQGCTTVPDSSNDNPGWPRMFWTVLDRKHPGRPMDHPCSPRLVKVSLRSGYGLTKVIHGSPRIKLRGGPGPSVALV